MKKLIALFVIALMLLMVGCGSSPASEEVVDSSVDSIDQGTESSVNSVDKNSLESDPFPAEWIGVWVCTKSDVMVIEEGNEVEFFDYGNKLSVTIADGDPTYWWIYYNAGENLFYFYLSDEFTEGDAFHEYRVAKQTDTQIILEMPERGVEITLEKQ